MLGAGEEPLVGQLQTSTDGVCQARERQPHLPDGTVFCQTGDCEQGGGGEETGGEAEGDGERHQGGDGSTHYS